MVFSGQKLNLTASGLTISEKNIEKSKKKKIDLNLNQPCPGVWGVAIWLIKQEKP